MVTRVSRNSRRSREDAEERAAAEPDRPHPTRRKRGSKQADAMQGDGAADPRAAASDFVRRGADALSSEAGGIAAALVVGVGAALIEAELIPGILLGAGAMLLGKLFPQIEGNMRPVMKAAVGAGLALADRARGLAAEAGEQVRDVVAEVRAERRAGGGRQQEAAAHAERFDAHEAQSHAAKPTHH